jgi:hypothetical protein
MADAAEVVEHGNEIFAIEVRGYDPIPEPERNMKLAQVGPLWAGTSVNMLSFALGALAFRLPYLCRHCLGFDHHRARRPARNDLGACGSRPAGKLP